MTIEIKIILMIIMCICFIGPYVIYIVEKIKARKNKSQESNKKEKEE